MKFQILQCLFRKSHQVSRSWLVSFSNSEQFTGLEVETLPPPPPPSGMNRVNVILAVLNNWIYLTYLFKSNTLLHVFLMYKFQRLFNLDPVYTNTRKYENDTKTMCRCITIVAFSLTMIPFSMKMYSCRRSLRKSDFMSKHL